MMLGLALALPATQGPKGDPAANAYIAAMSVAPDATRRGHINTLFASLRSSGVLSKLSHLYLLAAHDAQAARLNAVNPGTNNLTAFNSPTFTVDRGYQGDGSTSYLESGYTFPAGQQNDAHIGLYSRTSAQDAGNPIGNLTSFLNPRNASDIAQHRLNGTGAANVASTDGSGHFTSSRSGPLTGDNPFYRNASALLAAGAASVAPDASTMRICSRSSSVSFSSRSIAAAHFGTSLTAQNVTDLYNAVRTYLQAVGAA